MSHMKYSIGSTNVIKFGQYKKKEKRCQKVFGLICLIAYSWASSVSPSLNQHMYFDLYSFLITWILSIFHFHVHIRDKVQGKFFL